MIVRLQSTCTFRDLRTLSHRTSRARFRLYVSCWTFEKSSQTCEVVWLETRNSASFLTELFRNPKLITTCAAMERNNSWNPTLRRHKVPLPLTVLSRQL